MSINVCKSLFGYFSWFGCLLYMCPRVNPGTGRRKGKKILSFRGEKAGDFWLKAKTSRYLWNVLLNPLHLLEHVFNKLVVDKFYSTLKSVQDAKKIPAHRIYIIDEISVCTVPIKNIKMFAKTGRKQAARITSAERRVTTTAVICMSASGTSVPPMFIFRSVRMKIKLIERASPGSVWTCNISG